MVKTRVHDLAAEFDIPPEQLMQLLRDMDIFVRSHLSALEGDQVSAVRVRWEREKRRSATEAQPKRGRRKAKAAEPVAAEPAKPARRRRTAAEVAEAEAQAQAERAEAERDGLELEIELPRLEPEEPKVSRTLEERARELFKDLPPVEPEPEPEPQEQAATPEPAPAAPERPAASAAPASPVEETPAPPKPARAPFIPPRVPRPAAGSRPAGPRPVFSTSTPGSGTRERPAPARPGEERPAPASAGGAGGRRKGKKGRRGYVDQDAVQENIAKTLQGLKGGSGRKGARRSDEPSYRDIVAGRAKEEREKEKTRIRVNEFISVAELAAGMKIPATQIVQFAFKELGLMVTVNQRLDFDQIELIASEFGFEAVREQEYQAEVEEAAEPDKPEDLVSRPPVVTIMGHVDHGKTSLLDYIRKENIVAGEAGGITQHIGAYHVALPNGKEMTFLDTPGHQAFTAMRARGAQVTDIVVLVVAADDQVMPQTVEAISHARNAGVPMVVAINKIDLPSANVPKVKQDLLQHSVVLEEFGGQVLSAEISAKKGTGVEHLLEQVLLQAEILDLKANPEARPQGTVLEATLDPGKGPLATVLVQRGTLKVGDDFICGMFSGRVRALFDERGNAVTEAGPTIPVQVLGFDGVPSAGDTFLTVTDASEARDIAQKRQRLEREAQSRRSQRGTSLEDFSRALKEGEVSTLPIIIKADQGGPAEALADALAQLSTSEVRVDVVLRGVGAISESDVLLARASNAIILGFHVRPDSNARTAAEREGVDVRTYRVIYEAVDDVRKALEGLLKPAEKETVLGEAEVLQLFKVSKVGTIAGCRVAQGVITRGAQVRVIRDGVTVYTGEMSSLKRFKDDVREVREGQECGIGVENFNDLKVGDRIEAYRMEEVKRTLESVGTPGAA
ncbi:MAG TPA: translation initiation factor IF-2 [Gemmatimonadales bacterium]|nr:translation initiation factor IF-2 [Gemmatimonadales bacterium]